MTRQAKPLTEHETNSVDLLRQWFDNIEGIQADYDRVVKRTMSRDDKDRFYYVRPDGEPSATVRGRLYSLMIDTQESAGDRIRLNDRTRKEVMRHLCEDFIERVKWEREQRDPRRDRRISSFRYEQIFLVKAEPTSTEGDNYRMRISVMSNDSTKIDAFYADPVFYASDPVEVVDAAIKREIDNYLARATDPAPVA